MWRLTGPFVASTEMNPFPYTGFMNPVCIRAAQLAFCALVTCRGDQVRTSITSGVVDVFVTPDLTHPTFSVLVKFSKVYREHFGGDSPGLILITTDNFGVAPNFIPFVRGW